MEEGKTLQIKTRNGWIDVDADKDGVNIDYLLNDRNGRCSSSNRQS